MPAPTVPRDELAARCARAIALASERGLDALLVLGRGGGPVERHGSLLYLTGHYSSFPTIPDVPGRWAGRGYGAAVLAPDGDVVLVADVGVTDDVYATDIRFSHDVVAALIDVVRERRLESAHLGLVGGDVLSFSHFTRLRGALAGLRLEPAEDILDGLRMVKSAAEHELLRASAAAGVRAVKAVMEAVEAGRTQAELASLGAASAVRDGVTIANIFTRIYGRGRPRGDPLREGEVFTVDMSGALDGYFFDCSRSRAAGRSTGAEEQALMELAVETVSTVVDGLRPGATVGEATRSGIDVLRRAGQLETPAEFGALGHGLGLGFEPPWLLPDDATVLAPGMCIAVEKVVREGELGASFEHNVLVTDGAPEVLTAAAPTWWE